MLAWIVLSILPLAQNSTTKVALSFDLGMLVYILLSFCYMQRLAKHDTTPTPMDEDESEWAIVFFVILACVVSLVTIVLDMTSSKGYSGMEQTVHIILTVATIFLSWLFTYIMFALYYARLYYRELAQDSEPSLIFPDTNTKTQYWDFVYFSCVIGTSGQMEGVSFSSTALRKIGTIHCILSFFLTQPYWR